MAKARTAPHSPPAVHPDLAAVCPDLNEWPRNWMGVPEDIPLDRPGRAGLWCGGLFVTLPQVSGRRSRGDARHHARIHIRPLATLQVAKGRYVFRVRGDAIA